MRYRRKKNCWQQDISRKEFFLAVLRGVLTAILFSYLFYESILSAVLLLPYLVWFLKSWEKQYIKKKKQLFQSQFKEAVQSLSAALNAGYSVENAMKESLKDLQHIYKKDEKIVREFRYMVRQLDMNLTMETVLKEFSARVEDEDVQIFVTVFMMAKRSGGDLIGIIRNTVHQMGEKADVRREIETILSAKRLEFKVMTAIPLGMICYMKLSFPEFMNVLYGSLAGRVIMTICLAGYLAAYEFGRRIVEIEV